MLSRKNIAAVLAVAGLAAAGTVIAAEGAKEQGCGMERMKGKHERMGAGHGHGRHGGEAKQGDKPKEEEHKH